MTASKKTTQSREQEPEYKKLAEERLDQLRDLQADFDNYRKQFDKEKEHVVALANEKLINDLLVFLDDFDHAIDHTDDNKTKEGLLHLHQKIVVILQRFGLKPVEALGRAFDPQYHEVIQREESEKEDGTVIKELQRGYLLHKKVIRPSKVRVAKNKEQ